MEQQTLIPNDDVIIFDTETTGFENAEIIEAAWLVVDHPTKLISVGGYHERFKPSKRIELGALSTHHILEDELQKCRPSSEFKLPNGLGYMIGHNVDFDWKVAGEPDVKRICTLALSRWLFPDTDAHNQTAMMYHLFKDHYWVRDAVKNAHSALHDVCNCQEVLKQLVGEMVSRGHTVATWDDLWRLSEKARIPTKMSFGKHKGMLIKDLPSDYRGWLLRQPDLDPYLLKALRGF